MYTRKIYEPENELRIQIPGHGIGSAAGSSAQQEVRGKVSQPQKDRAASSGTAEAGRRNTTKSGLPTLYAPKKNTWLSKGAFEDGYQFGDVVRGVNGTILETSENVTAGALDLVENTIDSVAGRAAGFGVLEEPLKKFVARDLIDEEKWARGYYRYGSLHGLTGMLFGVDPDRDSFLGEKAESLAQSVGQLTLAKAASLVGIPGEAVVAVNAYGAEMENAYRNGATPREANISASITAVGEVGTEMLSGAIKFGGTAVDDLLVENLSDGISNKLLKGLAGMAVGGTGEGAEEVLSEVISRFGQWITYMDDKTFTEMLLSGDAREAYMDSFIGGLLLGIPSGVARAVSTKNDGDPSEKTRGAPAQERTADPGVAQSQVTAPAEAKRPTTASRAEDALRRVHMGEPVDLVGSETKSRSAEMTTDTDAAVPDRAETPKAVQPEGDVPYFTSDHWTGELEGMWTDAEADPRTAADTAIDMDSVYGTDIRTETDTKAVEQQPMRYEDALKAYLEGDTRFSAKPDVQTGRPDAAPNADPTAGPEILRETASKPKDQVIAELAPKLQKPGTTPGRATIAAQQTYADAQKRFGSNANTVLEHIQQGQDPRRFLDGFQNAYILGKQGAGPDALNNSSAAAHLTVEQRQLAYDLGSRAHDTRYRATLDIVNGNGTMDSDGFWIGRSLGAKAKNYKVLDLETGEYFYFVEGTGLKNVEVFAGPNSRKPYEKAYKFAEKYGGAINDWQHVKGVGWLETPEGIRLAEVHWSQCAGIGKVEFFVKKWKDE